MHGTKWAAKHSSATHHPPRFWGSQARQMRLFSFCWGLALASLQQQRQQQQRPGTAVCGCVGGGVEAAGNVIVVGATTTTT